MKIGPHPGEKLAHRYCTHADCRLDAYDEMMAMAVALKRPDVMSHAPECFRADVQVVCRRTARKGPMHAPLPVRREEGAGA